MPLPEIRPLQVRLLTIEIADISTASERFVAPGFDGEVVEVFSALDGAITAANAVLTPKISGTAITGGGITVAFTGSAAGDIDSAKPTGANKFTAGNTLSVATDGGSTGTVAATVTFVCMQNPG